jgi:hypothetical protein
LPVEDVEAIRTSRLDHYTGFDKWAENAPFDRALRAPDERRSNVPCNLCLPDDLRAFDSRGEHAMAANPQGDGSGSAKGSAVMEPPADPRSASMDAAAAAVAQIVPATLAAGSSESGCSNCQAPMARGQTFCRRCGFYPTLNIFVEVDPTEAVEGADPTAEPRKSHVQVWKSLIPRWAWVLIAGVAALLILSVAARLFVPAGPGRAAWTYAQFGIGVIAFITAHVLSYMSAIMVNDTLNFLDIILKPFAIWSVTWNERPKSLKRMAIGAWGLTAALFAAFVVAGVRYDEIIDWGKVPPKKKAKKTVGAKIDAPADDKSMEEALEDFTDKAGVEMSEEELARQKANRKKMAKCLIVGFTPHRENDFDKLILAVDEGGGHWRFAGVMKEGLSPEARSELNRRMRLHLRATPVVPCDVKAFWLEPKFMCSIWFEDWGEDRMLIRPFFEKLLPDFEPKKKQ